MKGLQDMDTHADRLQSVTRELFHAPLTFMRNVLDDAGVIYNGYFEKGRAEADSVDNAGLQALIEGTYTLVGIAGAPVVATLSGLIAAVQTIRQVAEAR